MPIWMGFAMSGLLRQICKRRGARSRGLGQFGDRTFNFGATSAKFGVPGAIRTPDPRFKKQWRVAGRTERDPMIEKSAFPRNAKPSVLLPGAIDHAPRSELVSAVRLGDE